MLANCITSLRGQVAKIIVINTRPDGDSVGYKAEDVIEVWDSKTPNISRWWNTGIELAYQEAEQESEWNVLVVNDDVIVPSNLVDALSASMRQTTAVLASPNMYDNQPYFHGSDSHMAMNTRLTGYTFMLRGESDLRIDETLAWWWSDTDLEMRARQEGGVVLVPGCSVTHLDPNGYTDRDPYLSAQAGRDRETFIRKWGSAPW